MAAGGAQAQDVHRGLVVLDPSGSSALMARGNGRIEVPYIHVNSEHGSAANTSGKNVLLMTEEIHIAGGNALRRGQQGTSVRQLQEALNRQGARLDVEISGGDSGHLAIPRCAGNQHPLERLGSGQPAGNDAAITRWNGCARIIKANNLSRREMAADFIE